MIILYFYLLITSVFAQQMSGDPLIVRAIKENIPTCRNSNPRNCIRPVNQPGSKIKAIEINVQSKESVSFTTYDMNGVPTDVEPNFSIKVMAQREPAIIDANIQVKADASSDDLVKLCDLRNAEACFNLGKRRLDEKKEKEAIDLLAKSCNLNYIDACKFLSSFFLKKKDIRLVSKFIQVSCNLKDQKSCLQLGIIYMSEQKVNEALDIFLPACNTSAEGCFFLGEVFEKENPISSLNAYEKGCNFQNGAALCYLAASILDKSVKSESRVKARSLYDLSCNKGYRQACDKLPANNLNQLKQSIRKSFNLFDQNFNK